MSSGPKSDLPVTQRDIARVLGISHATVSLALRDCESLSSARREEVKMAAKRMGYRPNAIAMELARLKRSSNMERKPAVLAWIDIQLPKGKTRTSKQLDRCRKGANEVACMQGYVMETIRIAPDIPPEDLRGILQSRGVRGICLQPRVQHLDWSGFPWEEYPAVRLGQWLENPPCDVVSSDHVSNAMLAFARMRMLGYRRIGFVASGVDSAIHGGRLSEAGFLAAQRSVPSGDRVPVLLFGDDSYDQQAEWIAKWVRVNRIDGILSDSGGIGGMLADGGLSVPGDVGVACLGLMNDRSLSGIDQHLAEIGKAGLSLLHALVVGGGCRVSGHARKMLVPGSWVDGDSLPQKVEWIGRR
jgi:DNA-binding LacI/PurR family transcriptional regulator